MRGILFLVHRAPWPPDRGDRIRSWHEFEALCRIAPVHVAALADSEADAALARERMAAMCASLEIVTRQTHPALAVPRSLLTGSPLSLAMFRNSRLKRHVAALAASGVVDRAVIFSSQMTPYLPANLPFVMDFCDVDSAKFAAYGHDASPLSLMGRVYAREGRLLAAHERQVASYAAASLFISDAERGLFLSGYRGDASHVHVVGNGIDTARFDPAGDWRPLDQVSRGEGRLCVFTGQMDYQPNVDAVRDFALATLPSVRARHPDARFAIVGRAPTAEVLALGKLPGVMVTGEVPDTRPWLAAADVVVAPLAIARGVQNKLLEAMAMAKPVVASTHAATGIDAVDGRDWCIADGSAATAGAIATLLDDPDRTAVMGRSARAQMLGHYGWSARMAPLLRLVESLVA